MKTQDLVLKSITICTQAAYMLIVVPLPAVTLAGSVCEQSTTNDLCTDNKDKVHVTDAPAAAPHSMKICNMP